MPKVKTYKVFNAIAYPDSTTYDCAEILATLPNLGCEWYAALHDKDVNEDGTPKKTHYHFILRFEEGKTIQTVAKDLNLPENDIERPKKGGFKGGVQYLIHANAPDKYQYDKEIIFGSGDATPYLAGDANAKGIMLMDAIYGGRVFTIYELYQYAKELDAWSEFRRGFGMYNTVLASMRYDSSRKSDDRYEADRAIQAELLAARWDVEQTKKLVDLPQETIPEFNEQASPLP